MLRAFIIATIIFSAHTCFSQKIALKLHTGDTSQIFYDNIQAHNATSIFAENDSYNFEDIRKIQFYTTPPGSLVQYLNSQNVLIVGDLGEIPADYASILAEKKTDEPQINLQLKSIDTGMGAGTALQVIGTGLIVGAILVSVSEIDPSNFSTLAELERKLVERLRFWQ